MSAFVALLRAVNVGGTGKLPMGDLVALCEALGFSRVRTYIASGNVVFESPRSEAEVKAMLEAALARYAGRPVGVLIRESTELAALLAANPFHNAAPNRVVAIFLDTAPPHDALATISNRGNEAIAPGVRELYVHYPDGMGRSKLKIPAAKAGTARNINTIAALVTMAAAG